MSIDFPLSVDLDNPIAVYVQVENQIQFAIASGRVQPGDTLPSVREMSTRLDINPNTVTKAYRDLELMGLVHTRRGVGVTVAPEAYSKCHESVRAMVMQHLRDAAAECAAAGIAGADIRKQVDATLKAATPPYAGTAQSTGPAA